MAIVYRIVPLAMAATSGTFPTLITVTGTLQGDRLVNAISGSVDYVANFESVVKQDGTVTQNAALPPSGSTVGPIVLFLIARNVE
jgi:hypothetical protein